MNTSISSQILDELLTTVETIGIDNTIKTLQNAKSNFFVSDIDITFVLDSTQEITGTAKERILYGSDRSDERKIALSLCIYTIREQLGYSYPDMKKVFKKDAASLSRYYSFAKNIPKKPKTDFDKKLDDYIKKMDILLTEKKINDAK